MKLSNTVYRKVKIFAWSLGNFSSIPYETTALVLFSGVVIRAQLLNQPMLSIPTHTWNFTGMIIRPLQEHDRFHSVDDQIKLHAEVAYLKVFCFLSLIQDLFPSFSLIHFNQFDIPRLRSAKSQIINTNKVPLSALTFTLWVFGFHLLEFLPAEDKCCLNQIRISGVWKISKKIPLECLLLPSNHCGTRNIAVISTDFTASLIFFFVACKSSECAQWKQPTGFNLLFISHSDSFWWGCWHLMSSIVIFSALWYFPPILFPHE